MIHRYLRSTWWVSRLAVAAERFVPPHYTMQAHVWSAAHTSEPELMQLEQWAPRHRLALDIGANHGIYAWRLRSLARAVHAFEPNPHLVERLRAALPSVQVHGCALSDRDGEAELRVPRTTSVAYHGWGTVEVSNQLTVVRSTSVDAMLVPLRRLDGFELDDVGFIKIDVEGHELAVLRGVEQTLRRCRPNLLFEADDQHRPQAMETVRTFLSEFGYVVSPALAHCMWIAVPMNSVLDQVQDLKFARAER